MAFGKGNKGEKRRKTKHINDAFKEFAADELTKALGIKFDTRMALSLIKIVTKLPLRFLMTIKKEDFDQNGERSIVIPGIGKYKIMETKARGKRLNVASQGVYPRYKYYPSGAVEAEVEMLYGVGDEESKTVYNRVLTSEERNIGLNIEEIQRQVKKMSKDMSSDISLEKVIKKLVADEIKRKEGSSKKSKEDVAKLVNDVKEGVEKEEEKEIKTDSIPDEEDAGDIVNDESDDDEEGAGDTVNDENEGSSSDDGNKGDQSGSDETSKEGDVSKGLGNFEFDFDME